MHPAARRSLPRRRLLPEARDRAALLRFLKPRPGLYARLSRDARLRAARPGVSGVPGDLVAGGARLLPQVHGRRAHAADDPQPRAARRRPTAPYRQRFRNVARRASRRPSCSCSRCCSTTSASGATTTTRSRACGWPRTCSTACSCRRGARDGAVPDPASPADVARGVPARHRGSGDRQAVRRARRHRGAAEDALPDDAGRRRGGQPRNADAVEGGAAVAALRRHLQPPDAALRRRADRAQPGRARRAARRAGPTDLAEAEITGFLEGLPQRYLQLFPRDAIYRHVRLARDIQPGRGAPLARARTDVGVDARGRHARQAVPVLEHLRRAVVVRHGHPARPRADQPERPGARRLPVHRRRAVPRAERRRARRRCCTCCRTSSRAART